ncbi:MAG: ketoacyl-ACP synthase III [Candidatus Margulisbacteria bacterium]|nr:ketoacyl-ACP synthase III [Candidatus Margulisiibacteriota bacterium]
MVSTEASCIRGIVCAVPKEKISNQHFSSLIGEENLQKFETVTGISERRVVSGDVCAIQHRFGIGNCAAFDINLGCSGYVYGLWLLSMMVAQKQFKRVLLLVGDTCSKFVSPLDKSTAALFGDAGSATLIEYSETGSKSHFLLGTDGSGVNNSIIPAGGFRTPATSETANDLYMNGGEIFNFTTNQVSSAIQEITELYPEPIDFYVFHQANKFMLEHLAKKLRLPKEQVLYSLNKFGNTSSAFIPLTIVTTLEENRAKAMSLFIAGFGVGYSWAVGKVEIPTDMVIDLIEL